MKATDYPSELFVKGRMFDMSEVWGEAKLSKDSTLAHCASIHDKAEVADSVVQRFGRVYGRPLIAESLVTGTAIVSGQSFVYSSVVGEQAAVMDKAQVLGSIVAGYGRVADRGAVCSSIVDEFATVRGDAQLYNAHLNGQLLIHEGIWDGVVPVSLGWPHHEYQIQTCVPGKVIIGCMCGTMDEWLRKGLRHLARKRWRLSEHVIDEYEHIIRSIK